MAKFLRELLIVLFCTAVTPHPGIQLHADTNTLSPVVVAGWPPFPRNAEVRTVRLAGDLAFIGLDGVGVSIANLANPGSPQVIGGVRTSLSVWDLALKDEWLFIAAGTNGVQIVNAENAAHPVLSNTFSDARDHARIAIAGNLAISVGTNGATVLDVSNPAAPRLLSRIPGDYVDAAFGADGTVFLASHDKFQAIDVKDPSAPVVLTNVDSVGYVWSIYVTNNVLFAPEFSNSVEIYDVSDPSNFVKKSAFPTFNPTSIFVLGHYGYISRENTGFDIVDLTDLTAPTLVSTFNLERYFDKPGNAVVYQDYLLLAAGRRGLQIIDIGNRAAPKFANDIFGAWGQSASLAVTNGFAYLADGGELRVIDLRRPGFPHEVTHVPQPTGVFHLTLASHYVLLSQAAGSELIDIRDPAQPTHAASYPFESWQGYYLPDKNLLHAGGYHIPLTPPFTLERALWNFQPETNSIVTNYLAFPSGAELWLLDPSDEKNPAVLSHYVANSGIEGFASSGRFLYLALPLHGLEILDVSNPRQPVQAGLSFFPSAGRSVAVQGDVAFLASMIPPGITMLDVHDPPHPIKIKDLPLPSDPQDMTIAGNLLFVASGNAGLQVIDLSNSLEPTLNVSHYSNSSFLELNAGSPRNYILESTTSLNSPTLWSEILNTTLTNHPQTLLRLDTDDPGRFYRIRSN